MEVINLSDKDFKGMVIMMLTKLKRRMNEHSENFKKDIKNEKVQNRCCKAEEYNS